MALGCLLYTSSVHSDNFLSLPSRPSERIIAAYKQLAEEEKLTVKVYEEASFTSFEDMKAFIDQMCIRDRLQAR